ncbi:MAG: discoidin domain-containing protein [Kineosporiaceae bacterium]|nr:discoidin domain-containing protein [Kineosporiaceae bacterium]MBK8075712.1 discoidin domain-containing protein [Kineosporiaceae bacterium]
MAVLARRRWRGSALLLAAASLALPAVVATPAAAAACPGSALTIVAHEDDDTIFVNPDVLNDIRAGRCVRTLFVTAGDAGNSYPDSLYRENGPKAAYAQMAGVANNWVATDDGVSGRTIQVLNLAGNSRVSIAFLRLPDGFPSGQGSATYGGRSLSKLWTGSISSITAVDGSETYSRSTLISTLAAMMADFQPTTIRTQDYVSPVSDADHSDHLMTAAFTLAADSLYTSTAHTLMAYQGYGTASRPANVSGVDLTRKQAALAAEAQFDPGAADPWVQSMVPRRYVLDSRAGGPAGGNRPPVANAGADQSVSAGSTVTLSGSGSSDPDGNTLTYAWTQTSGPAVTLSSATAVSPTFTAPAAGSSVTFSLVVSDGSLSSVADTVTVSVVANRAPVANAGADQSVSAGSTVTLSGSGSSDPDGNTLTYAWTQTSGPAVTLSSATAVSPTFTAPAAGSSVTFSLVVSDGSLSSVADTVTVSVPAAGAANVARTLGATATASTQNTGDGQTAAKAIDGSPLGYPADYSREWASVRQGAGAWIQLTWANSVTLDHVVLNDRPNASDQITSGTLTFSDGSSAPVGSLTNDGSAVTVTFTPRTVTWVRLTVNTVSAGTGNVGLAEFEAWGVPANGGPTNRPPVANAGADQSVSAGSTVTLSGSGSSDPDGNTLTYAWTQTSGPAVTLSSATAVSPTFTAPAAGSSVTFSLVVSDGSLSSVADTVTVSVVANRAPVANAGADQSVSAGSTVTLSGSGSSDPDGNTLTYAWTQTSGPAVTLSSATAVSPTFTAPAAGSSVTFSLVVSDGSLSSVADTVTVSVPAAGAANVARTLGATATASTQNTGDGQTAAKAIDGSPLGYPADYSREWASVRQGAGAWIQLTWANSVTLDHVVLNDRPNASDQITSGTLTFSDGSSAPVGSLTNDGSAVTVTFTPRTVTWVRLTVNTVSAGTGNVGLAEFEAWGVPAN